MEEFLSIGWTQSNTKPLSGKFWMDYIWGASIVETCLRMIIDLWKMKNEEVHGKEEATKQQKRKAKVAISVWSLHDLQELACPSDSFLFYPNVGEEIEHATVAKLEGFIVMETRPIHNSVSEWAKQATSKVRSIVKRIKTEGKNNREVLERLEKRHRDHFWHKEHKKPREKTKGRDSTVYSTLRQTSLSGFRSLKNDLYWSVRGLLYLFQ